MERVGKLNGIIDDLLNNYLERDPRTGQEIQASPPSGSMSTSEVIQKYGGIENWDVSQCTNFATLFYNKATFTADLSKWNTANVINMYGVFTGAKKFNGDVSKWVVSRVTDISNLFSGAAEFNGDISKWDVSNNNGLTHIFRDAVNFNGDLSKWSVSSVTNFNSGKYHSFFCIVL